LAKARHVPERRCVACGQRAPKKQFTRIVRTPEGTVLADATGKASGRGGYLCSSGDCWEKGIGKGSLERNLQVTISREDRARLLDYYRSQVAQAAQVEA